MNMSRHPRRAAQAAASLFSLALFAAPCVGFAQTTPTPPQDDNTLQPQETTFEQIDTNGDGFIVKDEIPANDPLQNRFMKLDENGDDKLSRDEFDDQG